MAKVVAHYTRRPILRAEHFKPDGYESWMTLGEVAVFVRRDPKRIVKLEAEDKIPRARRVECGKLSVRLWSPEQVEEIRDIVNRLRPGRKPKGV